MLNTAAGGPLITDRLGFYERPIFRALRKMGFQAGLRISWGASAYLRYMGIGRCKLCQKEKELQKSHLIPRAAYGICRATEATNPNPLMVTHRFTMQTSRQTQWPLLCFDCEQLLREKGEDWVLPRLARYKGQFLLGEELEASTPLFNEPDVIAYTLEASATIRVSDLTHFAMGIFWKAAVHGWMRKAKGPWIRLGEHTEGVRKYLVGESEFPKEMALSLSVLPTAAAISSFHLPYETMPAPGYTTFHLYIGGLNYTLWVGPEIPHEAKLICLSAKPNAVLVFDCAKEILKRFQEAYAEARKRADSRRR